VFATGGSLNLFSKRKKKFSDKNLKLKNDRSKLAKSPLAQPLAQLKAFFITDRSAARSAHEFFAVDRSSARSAQQFFCENRNPVVEGLSDVEMEEDEIDDNLIRVPGGREDERKVFVGL
jgi:hypothetical protein